MSDDVRGCGCQLQEGESSGNGWHTIIAQSNFCWEYTVFDENKGKRVRPYILKSESRMDDGRIETITECMCARRVELLSRDGSNDDLLKKEMPNCTYRSTKVMTERCPAYWESADRSVSIYDPRELAPVGIDEENRRRRKKDKFAKALEGGTAGPDGDIPF